MKYCNGQPTFNCWRAKTAKSSPIGLRSRNSHTSLISSTFEIVNLAEIKKLPILLKWFNWIKYVDNLISSTAKSSQAGSNASTA